MALSIDVAPLDDSQWATITSRLPRNLRSRVRTKDAEYRAFVDAVLWVVRNDACWKCVPSDGWRAIYVRFIRWVDQGIWGAVEHGIGSDPCLIHALRDRVASYSTKKRRRRRRSGENPKSAEINDSGTNDRLASRRAGQMAPTVAFVRH
ncbi:transposase [Pseudomonas sp. CGJS7]|uniref:transposase n=1 Tax=Pseudomonas sp. CGJS7 TaxID=3109348 RepID=UPI003FA6CA73